MRATRLIWTGLGCPVPTDGTGVPLPSSVPEEDARPCAMCGEPGGRWGYNDAFSENFWPVRNRNRLFPYAERGRLPKGGLALCAACVFCTRSLALRCAPWWATKGGVQFYPSLRYPKEETRPGLAAQLTTYYGTGTPDALAELLSPPEPPFVAGFPAYGAAHGGESNHPRCVWPGRPKPEDPLSRLQAKHVAVYAQVSYQRDRYQLQVDDALSLEVDVPLWRTLRREAEALALQLRAGGVRYSDTRRALTSLTPPPRTPLALLAHWKKAIAAFVPHRDAAWWGFFVALLPIPDATRSVPEEDKEIACTPTPQAPPPPQLSLL